MKIRGGNIYLVALDLGVMLRMLDLQTTMPLQDFWQMRFPSTDVKSDQDACVPHRIKVLNKLGQRLNASLRTANSHYLYLTCHLM
jgi:hypothetical protein